ncbi:UBC-like protein [Lentinula detonsa]|uniref:UBC-like protein n=1 Tax=Lentinula detonsa TaxID=2804962 RepID=A0AA38PQ64_9AGAR|nr:UBC-like protein [Lentinula detonsa]
MFSPLGPPLDVLTKTKSQSRPAHRSSKSTSQPSEAASPAARAAISLEYASLRNRSHCPLGLYVVPTAETLLVWDAVLFIHQGYYADSILKFKLTFPYNYPERPPAVQFINDVFHPLISSSGTFALTPQIRAWRPNQHHVFDVLHFIKAAFKRDVLDKIEEADCLNKEAYKRHKLSVWYTTMILDRYHESTTSFAALATQTSSLSQSDTALYDKGQFSLKTKPAHAMHFAKLKVKTLKEERERLGFGEWQLD